MTRHPEYLGRYCPTCRQDALPMNNGTCGFCDTPIITRDDTPLYQPGDMLDHLGHRLLSHGRGGYTRGCRCTTCVDGQRVYNRTYQRARRARERGAA